MTTWTCPDCQREFGAVGRNHMCSPGLSVDRFLAAAPAFVAPVFERVHEHLVALDEEVGGDLIVDPLAGKVLFKNGPTFCIVDAKTKWVAIGFSLRRRLESGRLSRKVSDAGNRFYHVVNIADPELVDDELVGWLTEAYHHGDDARGREVPDGAANVSRAPMVPDDVDFEIAPPP